MTELSFYHLIHWIIKRKFNAVQYKTHSAREGHWRIDYVLLVTRGRGGRGTHNQIYPGKVHRENMDTKHHQATHGNQSLYTSNHYQKVRIYSIHVCSQQLLWTVLYVYMYDRNGFCCWNILVYVWTYITTYMMLFLSKGVNLNSKGFRCDTEKKQWMWSLIEEDLSV